MEIKAMDVFNNIILLTDSYKVSHYKQYPTGTTKVFSYFESRGGYTDKTVFFGLQYFIKKYLTGKVITRAKIDYAKKILKPHFGDDVLNIKGWEHILEKHKGRLPVRIRSVPEGSIVPNHNVLLTIENTDPECFWLTNYLETLLVEVWYPTTVATYSHNVKSAILKYLEKTGTPELINFKFHDFGFRGVSSPESAALGGAAHLVNFLGTDTIAGMVMLEEYYGKSIGHSIPAAEHSTITSWGRHSEIDAFRNMLRQYPKGLVAVVSDSYNIYDACKMWGTVLKDDIMSREGTLVVRPDSGHPPTVVLEVLDLLGKYFGHNINEKGYKVLPDQIRVIQGDGVDLDMVKVILQNMEKSGWSADNIAFGCGGGLLQKCNRDTLKFAFKCCAVLVDGVWRDVFKDPITDPGKKSKAGRLDLLPGYITTRLKEGQDHHPDSLLRTTFEDGDLLANDHIDDIKLRALA